MDSPRIILHARTRTANRCVVGARNTRRITSTAARRTARGSVTLKSGRLTASASHRHLKSRRRRLSMQVDEDDIPEMGGASDAVSNDWKLGMFNLDLRADLIPLGAWAVKAKARAEQIRFGNESQIQWWGADKMPYPLQGVRLKADTGLHAFQVDDAVCQGLLEFLTAASNYDSSGYLKLGGKTYAGYARYPYVHAPGGNVTLAQAKRTVRVQGKVRVNDVLKSTEQLWALVDQVRRVLGLPIPGGAVLQKAGKCIVALHFLVQDATEQAVFSWHDDGEDIWQPGRTVDDMTTVIVNLSPECSGMRIWGCSPFLYTAQGQAVAFPGSALHESLPRLANKQFRGGHAVHKVALFFN